VVTKNKNLQCCVLHPPNEATLSCVEATLTSLLHVSGVVFNAIFNNISIISWLSVLLVEETGVLNESYRPTASH